MLPPSVVRYSGVVPFTEFCRIQPVVEETKSNWYTLSPKFTLGVTWPQLPPELWVTWKNPPGLQEKPSWIEAKSALLLPKAVPVERDQLAPPSWVTYVNRSLSDPRLIQTGKIPSFELKNTGAVRLISDDSYPAGSASNCGAQVTPPSVVL